MIKTFDEIEFDGEVVTLHGVGEFGYSQSFDLDSVDIVSPFISINGVGYYTRDNAKERLSCVVDVIHHLEYAKQRLTPANVTFDEMIKELAK